MKLKLLIINQILCCGISASAQFTGHYNALNITGGQNVLKTEIPMDEPSVVGSTYLNENWDQGLIVTKSGYAANLPIRIELEQSNIEVKIDDQVKYLNLKKIDSVFISHPITKVKRLLVGAKTFASDGESLKGIALVQYFNAYGIVDNYYIETLTANYNVAMDVGSKDHRKVKRHKTYLIFKGELIPVKGSNKKIASRLGVDEEKALTLLKERKLDLTNESDLVTFVTLMVS